MHAKVRQGENWNEEAAESFLTSISPNTAESVSAAIDDCLKHLPESSVNKVIMLLCQNRMCDSIDRYMDKIALLEAREVLLTESDHVDICCSLVNALMHSDPDTLNNTCLDTYFSMMDRHMSHSNIASYRVMRSFSMEMHVEVVGDNPEREQALYRVTRAFTDALITTQTENLEAGGIDDHVSLFSIVDIHLANALNDENAVLTRALLDSAGVDWKLVDLSKLGLSDRAEKLAAKLDNQWAQKTAGLHEQHSEQHNDTAKPNAFIL